MDPAQPKEPVVALPGRAKQLILLKDGALTQNYSCICARGAHWLAESMLQYTPKRWATPAPALQCLLRPLCLL